MAGLEFRAWELACYCIILVLGLAGNSLVCLVVLKNGPVFRAVPFNIFLMSLAIVDLLISLIGLPFYLLLTKTIPHPSGIGGTVLCKISHVLPFWFAGVSVYLLVVISFERYEAINDPLATYARRIASKTTRVYIVGVWMLGLLIQLPTVIGIKYAGGVSTVGNCVYIWGKEVRREIYPFTFLVQFVIPACIFILNFVRIHICLSKLGKSLRCDFSSDQVQKRILRRKTRTVRVLFLASVAFFVCWTPNNVMYFLFQYFDKVPWNSDLYQFGVLLGFLNSCINPFLYAFQSKDFRESCGRVLRKMMWKSRDIMPPRKCTSDGLFSSLSDTRKLISFS